MNLSKFYIRVVMLYNFKWGLKAAQLAHHMKRAFGEDTTSEGMAQDWLAHFQNRDADVEDQHQSGSPSVHDDERLRQLVKDDLPQETG